ncbi:MAG: hypothetical protein R3264_05695 [Anaerolineae bacterium]|nr:hypothetical protein [Anaerolineae bacterium]
MPIVKMRSGPAPHLRMLHSAKLHKLLFLSIDFATALIEVPVIGEAR